MFAYFALKLHNSRKKKKKHNVAILNTLNILKKTVLRLFADFQPQKKRKNVTKLQRIQQNLPIKSV